MTDAFAPTVEDGVAGGMRLVYSGDLVKIRDPDTGEVVTAEVLAIHHSDENEPDMEFLHCEWRTEYGDKRSDPWICPARGDFVQWVGRKPGL